MYLEYWKRFENEKNKRKIIICNHITERLLVEKGSKYIQCFSKHKVMKIRVEQGFFT